MHPKKIAETEERRLMTEAEVVENEKVWQRLWYEKYGYPPTDDEISEMTRKASEEEKARAKDFGATYMGVYDANDDEVCGRCRLIADGGPYRITDAHWPPFHDGCRCSAVSLTSAEDWEPQERAKPRSAEEQVRWEVDSLLASAREAQADTDARLAWACAKRALKKAEAAGDDESRWSALGVIGLLHEKDGHLDEAIETWSQAFAQGSTDVTTAERLTLNLERRKEYARTLEVIYEALQRGLPADVDERLRKRAERCKARTTKGYKASEVPAFSVRVSDGSYGCRFQSRLDPPAQGFDMSGSLMRCFGASKGSGTLVDLDVDSGTEVRRVDSLPEFRTLRLAPSGDSVATTYAHAVGQGATGLCFLDPDGAVLRGTEVPDSVSDVAVGPGLWYVGCRDGYLYAFGLRGEPLWRWETPGSQLYSGDAYLRPCPYQVVSDGDFAVLGSWDNLYAVRPDGQLLWKSTLPSDPSPLDSFLVNLPRCQPNEALARFGLSHGASDDEIKQAYHRLAKETHPDLHPGDGDAAAGFRAVHAAYETLMAGGASASGSVSVSFSFSLKPAVGMVAVRQQKTVVSASNGRVFTLDATGKVVETHALGRQGAGRMALHSDGSLAAVWNDGTLFSFSGGYPAGSFAMADLPYGLVPVGDSMALWNDNKLRIVSQSGAVRLEADFARRLVGVSPMGSGVACVTGAVVRFDRPV
jgi:outer membrane protein assembly factor BamB